MTVLLCEMQCDETMSNVGGEETAKGYSYEGDATVRISNPAAENGEDQEPGALTWLNSARITTDPEEDAVHCVVSVADPRGGFCFTVRRLPNGHLVIHVPHPDESLPHCKTKWDHPGTLIVVDSYKGEPVSFADPETETEQ